MTTQAIQLDLEPRVVLGKKVKTLRKAGIIPVHLYGPGVDDKALQCDQPTLKKGPLSQAGGTTPIIINVPGEVTDQLVFAREIQWEPVRGTIPTRRFASSSN
ncbi:MAG: hypothetical protein Ct9H300mP27_12830 [Chloroflexota bacterium]|nr:MAG: hypothetical protein Ct9H300mP27_12830 [Chloroflexota bacterium]